MDSIVKKLMENRMSEDFDPMFDEDLKKYIGKTLEELLTGLAGTVAIAIDHDLPNIYGYHGFSGVCNGVPWHYANNIIKDIKAGKNNRHANIRFLSIQNKTPFTVRYFIL